MILVGPKGLLESIAEKLGGTFKKVADSVAFQSELAGLDLPYDYRGQAELEKEISQLYAAGKALLKKFGLRRRNSRESVSFLTGGGSFMEG
jgi:tripartite-type tricarboxylate transporter receptor subunit TctC